LWHKDAFFSEPRVEVLKNIRGARNYQIMYVGHNIMREKYEVDVFHVPPLEVRDRQKNEENAKPRG
jgi:hypothetical protein